MTRLEYEIRKRRLKYSEVSRSTGISPNVIRLLAQEGPKPNTGMSWYVILSDYLNIRIDELVMNVDKVIDDGDRGVYKTTASRKNPLENYRQSKNLSYAQMRDRLNISRQAVQRAGRKDLTARSSIIRKIAKFEKITPEKFIELYGNYTEN